MGLILVLCSKLLGASLQSYEKIRAGTVLSVSRTIIACVI